MLKTALLAVVARKRLVHLGVLFDIPSHPVLGLPVHWHTISKEYTGLEVLSMMCSNLLRTFRCERVD